LTDPFLYETYAGEIGVYIALSHRLGNSSTLTTTEATKESHKLGIPLLSMPKTFRDVILIARTLGVAYIWIDSLCIIQDSERDWECESAEMGAIYRRAILTVVASGAENSNQGCFIPRQIRSTEALEVDLVHSAGKHTQIYLQLSYLYDRGKEPLDHRRWVLQEQQLSTRKIEYRREEMAWASVEAEWSERRHLDFTTESDQEERQQWYRTISNISRNPTIDSLWHNTWTELLGNYCTRQLTKPSDKLPALSAVAKALQPGIGGRYLAGLWESHILADLLWKRGVTDCCQVEEWRAPT
jgi:hypothetical protein